MDEQAVLYRAKQIAARVKPSSVWEVERRLEDEPASERDEPDTKRLEVPLTQEERRQFVPG